MDKEQVIPTLQQQERELEKKRIGKGLEEHFKLFNDLLKLKQASYTKAIIMLIVAFIHHITSQIRQYKNVINLHYSSESTILDQIIESGTYFDIQGLLRQDITINYIMVSVFLLTTIGNTLLYLILYVLQSDDFRVRKKFIGKKFVQLSEWYIWIFHYPALVVFFENIICGPSMDCSLTLERKVLIVISILGVIFGVFNIFFLSVFFHNDSSQKKDCLNTENSIYLAMFHLFRAFQAFLICFNSNEYSYLWIMMICIFLGYSFFLLNCLFYSGYMAFATSIIRNTFMILLIIMVSSSFSMMIDELCRFNTLEQQFENFSLFFTLSFLFLVCCFIYNLRNSNYEDINYEKASDTDFARQVFIVNSLLEVTNQDINVDLFFKGILQRHMEQECKHTIIQGEGRCFCKKKKTYDSKKRKEVMLDDWLIHKNIYVKFLIKSWIETKLMDNPNSIELQLLYARYMFFKFQNHQISLHILNSLEKRFLFIINRYKAYQLKMKIMRYVKHRNQESYREKLEIQNALHIEDLIETIKQNINNIMIQNCSFWKCLQKEVIDLKELDDMLKSQFEKIEQTNNLWVQIQNYLDFKKKWKFYYAWFTLYIQNKKLKNKILDNFQGLSVNENDIFSEEVQENNLEEDIASVKSDQELKIDMEKIDIKSKKIIFDKKACIIQTTDDPDSLIIKVNKQFTKIFGYTYEEVANKFQIAQLMPDIYSKVHPSLLNDYKLTGKANSLYSQRKVYCIHKSGYMFTAQKFLKLYVDLNGQSQFVVMIRPTDLNNEKKHDVIILNQDWEINGMTQNVIQSLQIDQSLFQKQKLQTLINILLFAPKLIQFSRACQLINEETDLELFGMQKLKKKKEEPLLKSTKHFNNLPGQIKIQVNMTNSGSNNLIPGKSGKALSSDVDLSSNYLQMQSLDVPDDKQFLQQASSVSDKNEVQDFKHQIDQYSEMQKDINEQQNKKVDEQIKKMYETQFQNNYKRIQTKFDNNAAHSGDISDDNISRDEIVKQKGQFVLDGKVNNGEPISFHMKLSDKFLAACKHYTDSKYKLYQIKKQQDDHVKLEEKQDKEKEKVKTKVNDKKLFFKQGTQQREFKKKARLMFQKAAERRKNDEDKGYYDLIKEIYQDILKDQQKVKSFKIICTISFYKIRDERIGIMKVSNISEILKNKIRQNVRKQSYMMLHKGLSREMSRLKSIQNNDGAKYLTMTSDGESKIISPLQPQTSPNNSKNQIKTATKSNGLGYQLQKEDNLEDLEEKDALVDFKGQPKMINWETFQNQFKMQQGTQSFSLNVLDNIFRKEDNNKPRKLLVKISYLTWFLRFMYVTILTLNLITYFLKPYSDFLPIKTQSARILQLSQMQTYIFEAYDTIMDLLLYKNANFSNLLVKGIALNSQEQFFNYQTQQIDQGYEFFKLQIRDLNLQETFLDESIFYSNSMIDETIAQNLNVPITLDYKDIFTKVILIEHQVSILSSDELIQLNESNSLVKFIRNVTLPTLYLQFNTAVMILEDILSDKASSMSDFVIIILILESCIFIIGFFGLLLIILWICQTFKAVLKMFIMIKKNDLNKIVKQQQFVQTQFQYILNKDDEISGILQQNDKKLQITTKTNFQQQQNFLLINEVEDQNLTKRKDKQIFEKQLLKKLTIKMSLIYILYVLFSSSASLVFFLTLSNSSQQITLLISTGSDSIQDFSDSQLLLVSVKEKYFNPNLYNSNRLEQIQTILEEQIADIKSTPSIENPNYGTYYTSFQSIYFGNLCTYLAENSYLETDAAEDCQTVLNGKLKQGVVAFNQLYSSVTEDYVLNKETRFGQINLETIWQYNIAIDYIKSAFKALLTSWSKDLGNLIDQYFTLILVLLIVMVVFQLLVFITIAEMYLVNQLNKSFQFYRKIYKSYMPNDIIQKEKIIRASLIKYSIIKR
ncbi:unnamed protein product [Paramecium sonneborni]|uniref:PAS domain-containing protein n=1 Tax=Paramecium sonneborni TaxID=65129 RepID=A0A8S1NBJ0_9CILI|nr:unnamed protein product [Paramecium sonneborni]